MRSGFVAILGKPNAGKSTLINALLGEKIAITTEKAQTTRNAILGILNEGDFQIVFIDTPGIHEAKTALGTYMNREALSQAEGVDVIYYIVDGEKGLQNDDREILKKIFSYDAPVFLLMNKIDEVSSDLLIRRLAYAQNNYDFSEIIPISATTRVLTYQLIIITALLLVASVIASIIISRRLSRPIEKMTIRLVSTFLMSFGLRSDDMIVRKQIVIETNPAYEDGTPIVTCIDGHAEPRRESGSPRLTNDI